MKTTLGVLAAALIAAGTMFAQPRVAIGIGAGGYGPGYYPPPAYTQYMPPCPGPGYAWPDSCRRAPVRTTHGSMATGFLGAAAMSRSVDTGAAHTSAATAWPRAM